MGTSLEEPASAWHDLLESGEPAAGHAVLTKARRRDSGEPRARDPVDEYQLWLLPVVLGGGRPLFGERVGSMELKLLQSRSTDRGATLLRYEPR